MSNFTETVISWVNFMTLRKVHLALGRAMDFKIKNDTLRRVALLLFPLYVGILVTLKILLIAFQVAVCLFLFVFIVFTSGIEFFLKTWAKPQE